MTVALPIDTGGSWPLARQAEICNLQTALKVDEDVGGLEIEMDVSCSVDGFEAL